MSVTIAPPKDNFKMSRGAEQTGHGNGNGYVANATCAHGERRAAIGGRIAKVNGLFGMLLYPPEMVLR